jgi:DNA-binding LacI/PurR family transcriptional regulator
MPATLRDVALRAGVSVRTVSNVVNGYARVSAERRARVQAAVDDLGYRPNLLARNLRQGRSRILALVLPELDVPYFAELARLVIAEARARGYTVIIDQTDGDEQQERELIMENAQALTFAGVIFSPLSLSPQQLRSRVSSAPLVLLGERNLRDVADHVAIDNVAAAREATEHLLSLGRRRIAAIGDQPPEAGGTAQLRTEGFRQAHGRGGIALDESLIVSASHFHRDDGARAMESLLARPDPPDALFCYNDLLALGAMRVALSRGLRIPGDLAIVGFDDIEDGRYSTPTLTTVAPDKLKIARYAVERLIRRIESRDHSSPEEIRIPHVLARRESTLGRYCEMRSLWSSDFATMQHNEILTGMNSAPIPGPSPLPVPVAANGSGDPDQPRAEYPRPQFVRQQWMCLNGAWEFEIDQGDSGADRGLPRRALNQQIVVPFAPESELSGIGERDFLEAVWYRRVVQIPDGWTGMRLLLHFQAVDHDATVWVNGEQAGRHRGGFSSFTLDITELAQPGAPAEIVVRARDSRHGSQARGKQSTRLDPYSCLYPRTTGIWQTVWLEPVPDVHLERPRITPQAATGQLHLELPVSRTMAGAICRVAVLDGTRELAAEQVSISADRAPRLVLTIPDDQVRLWSLGDPYLYRLLIQLYDPSGRVIDEAASYAGLRSVAVAGTAVLLNGEPVFQRLVLDQGWYPDGLMTAPNDEALVRDIELAQAAGFNGARLHQKVFEERFLYHADRLGYLVWGEFGDWGCGIGSGSDRQQPTASYITQWLEVLARDYSHPSIIGWCPMNETAQLLRDDLTVLDDVQRGMFLATKAMDRSRPVIDSSGYSHRVAEADVYDSHCYEQDPKRFASLMGGLDQGEPFVNKESDGSPWSLPYRGQPYFCSEFGGIWWSPGDQHGESSWGYGQPPSSEDEWHERFAGLVNVLLDDPLMFGYCYTQLTDVFQERNGIYSFDRSAKFDVARISKIQCRPAAFEQRPPA